MLLVEVYDNSGKLFKRRITDKFWKVEDWVLGTLIKKWCPYDNDYRLEIALDDYGCGEVIYHESDCEHEVVFKINTANIGTI